MTQATAERVRETRLSLKGNLVPLTMLDLRCYDSRSFADVLASRIGQAPDAFREVPVVLSLDHFDLDGSDPLDFGDLLTLARQAGLIVAGVRTPDTALRAAAREAGLVLFGGDAGRDGNDTESSAGQSRSGTRHAVAANAPQAPSGQSDSRSRPARRQEDQPIDPQPARPNKTKVVTQPVRSGQQIYAAEGDLIVLAPVSAGAELLAEGNIHVYAPLRGRALAGIQGREDAMIFCQCLEAELVSIAGQYKLSDELQKGPWKQPARMVLRDNRLDVEALS